MARKHTLVMLLLLLLGGCTTAQIEGFIEAQPLAMRAGAPIAPPPPDPYRAGKAHLGEGRLGLAYEEFRRALATEGANPRTLNALAIVYDELQRFDLAGRYYAHALDLDPDSPQTLNNLGRSLLRQGRPDRALPLLERARVAAAGEQSEVVQSNLEIARARLAQGPPAPGAATASDIAALAALAGGPRLERTALGESTLRTTPPSMSEAPAVTAPAPAPKRSSVPRRRATYEIANGTGRRHMAARTSKYLQGHGLDVNRLLNASHYGWARSQIRFRPGFEEAARELQSRLPIEVAMEESDAPVRDVHLTLGADLLEFDNALMARADGG